MKEFLESPLGSALKTWGKSFVVALIVAAQVLKHDGHFGYDVATLALVLDSALFATLPVIVTYFDPTDSRYGNGSD